MAAENEFLLHALFMGIFITFVYDILRIVRRVIPHKDFFVSLEDLGFWIYCALEVFLMMYHESNGTLRWFAVLGAFTGMFAYKKLVSPYLVKYVSLLIGKVISPVVKFVRWVTNPIRKGASKLKNAAGKAKSRTMGKNNRLRWHIKKKLTFLVKMLKMTL